MFEFMSGPNQLNVKSYDDGIKLVREKKGSNYAVESFNRISVRVNY